MDDGACGACCCHGYAETGREGQQVSLPGDIEAWFEAPIYARVSGYLKAWYFDFGAHVEKGQLLAEIDAPDLDAQLAAAKARLARRAQVKVREAERNSPRRPMRAGATCPRASSPNRRPRRRRRNIGSADARYKASLAEANVNQSQVDQLTALEAFKRIVAPFDGVVTPRNTDIGALINAGSGTSTGRSSSGLPMCTRCGCSFRCRRNSRPACAPA